MLKGFQFLALQFTLETESTEEEQISESELNDVFADDLLNHRKNVLIGDLIIQNLFYIFKR